MLYISYNNDVEINLKEIKVISKRFKIIRNNNNRFLFYFQTIIDKNRARTLIIKDSDQNENKKISF